MVSLGPVARTDSTSTCSVGRPAAVCGCTVVAVPAAYTSQTCSACGHRAAESRESQADFRCVACGYQANADLNAANVILGAGLALTARGDLRAEAKAQ